MFVNLILIALYLICILPIIVLGYLYNKSIRWYYIGCFFIIFIINQVMLSIPRFYQLNPEGADWNWMGKMLPIISGLLFLLIFKKKDLKEFNYTLKQKRHSVKPVLIVGILTIAVTCVISLLTSEPEKFNFETLLFQATMPGFEEELNFRGIYLGLLNMAFVNKIVVGKIKLSFGLLITSVLFGFVHGLDLSNNYNISFNIFPFILPLLGGFIFGWMAEKTGSILFSVIFHNASNFFPYLMLMLL